MTGYVQKQNFGGIYPCAFFYFSSEFPGTIFSWKLSDIDHFHKWRPIINSFGNIKISLTNLILKLIIQKSFYSETRLVRLI